MSYSRSLGGPTPLGEVGRRLRADGAGSDGKRDLLPCVLLMRHYTPLPVLESTMQYRNLGACGLKVSAISLGGWLTFGGSVDDATARRIVQAAIDRGVNFVDLADVYARGKAEQFFGSLIDGFTRSELVLSSKLFWPMSDDVNDRGLSRKHIFESVHRTLRNLKTDYLDLYFCHREDPETPVEETVRAMDDLVRQGKVLYWGTSVWSPKSLVNVCNYAARQNFYRPQVEQPRYNLLDRHVEARLLPTAKKLGMGVVVWSPLSGGVLTGKYNDGVPPTSRGATTHWLADTLTETNLQRVREFCRLAREHSHEPGQVALAWVLRREEVSSVITGATDVAQLESNLQALEVKLPEDIWSRIDELFPRG
jgi:voltage-dependent potassium channel beta subunit